MLGDKGAKMKIIANIENYMGVKKWDFRVHRLLGITESLLKRPDYEAKMKKKTAQLKDILENWRKKKE